MRPTIDPRLGDIEDDASSSKHRSLFSLAGSLLAEISLPKLAVAWGRWRRPPVDASRVARMAFAILEGGADDVHAHRSTAGRRMVSWQSV
jgi:hypothetical protein